MRHWQRLSQKRGGRHNTQYNDIQYNDIQHNNTQKKGLHETLSISDSEIKRDTQHLTLSITMLCHMLSVKC